MKHLFFLLALVTIMSSCGKETFGLTVDEYIAANNLTTTELSEGVHIIIHAPGVGNKPNINSDIEVAYEGRLTDGTIFDSSDKAILSLSSLVKGWQIGLPEIAINGSCTLLIPSEAGYGENGVASVPGNATIIFDVDLLDIL